MTCVTGPLTTTQLLEELPEIVKLLQTNGIKDLVVEFGSGCNLEANQLWQEIDIGLMDLVAFIQNSIEKGIFSPGQADLVLQDRDRSFECLLCHESDIHLMSDDDAIITEATRRWMDKGYGGFKMAANTDWEPM
jgi:hypothetical protein